jgi:hypothetical protein
VPRAGLEPARPCGQRILSPLRLPFRHPGAASPLYTGATALRVGTEIIGEATRWTSRPTLPWAIQSRRNGAPNGCFVEARTGIEPVYTALQAAASPLCHLADDSSAESRPGSQCSTADPTAPESPPLLSRLASRLLKKSPVDAMQGENRLGSAAYTVVREHFEPIFNAAARRGRLFQQPARMRSPRSAPARRRADGPSRFPRR